MKLPRSLLLRLSKHTAGIESEILILRSPLTADGLDELEGEVENFQALIKRRYASLAIPNTLKLPFGRSPFNSRSIAAIQVSILIVYAKSAIFVKGDRTLASCNLNRMRGIKPKNIDY